MNYYMQHHGILNQKWGVKNGPPYPLHGSAYSKSEKRAIYKERKKKNSIYNKKHFDTELSADKTTLSTLSYDKNRTKNVDMFYATHTKLDKHLYNALFNKPISEIGYDSSGKATKTQHYKVRINNKIKSNMKVASEDSGAKSFMKLYEHDRDFANFVNDSTRMQSYFVKDKYKFKGYRESKHVLDKMQKDGYVPSEKDMTTVYRMFNYVIPYSGDARGGKDVANQRKKFFDELKKDGYGAVLDTNDAIYGGFKATSPVIVFDMEQIIPKDVKQTTANSVKASTMVTAGRKALGL